MANYEIAQFAYGGKSSCLISYPTSVASSGALYPVNILGSQDPTGELGETGRAPYQQIILNGKYYQNENDITPLTVPESDKYFSAQPYFLRLTIPRNANYDLNFALLLIPDPPAAADLDQMDYQFIRYIHVPKSDQKGAAQSFVIAYERPKFYDANGNKVSADYGVKYGYEDTDVIVTEAFDYSQYKDKEWTQNELRNFQNKIFFERTGSTINYWEVKTKDSTNNLYFCQAGDYYGTAADREFAPIGATAAIINHSWIISDSDDTCTYDIIFKPRGAKEGGETKWSRLYLYLIPESWDNDIMWLYEDKQTSTLTQFYGRHVDLRLIKVELYKIKNLIGDLQVKRMGIWGRSELMFTINGEEIKIGPSGYYELQDFDINYLGVAALDNRDQFTIDVQYVA